MSTIQIDRLLETTIKKGASDLVQSACLDIFEHFQDFRGDTMGLPGYWGI